MFGFGPFGGAPFGADLTAGAAGPATGYSLTGPSTGPVSTASSNFTVTLTPSGGTSATATITPSDGGGGGTFTPTTVQISTGTPSATFTYTPNGTPATRTISATDDLSLTDPSNLSYVTTLAATGYTMTGPSSGAVGVASTNFTLTLTPSGGTIAVNTITPADGGGGGTFTPSGAISLTAGSATFTYTPGSSGAKTISATNTGGLGNPSNLTYTASGTTVPILVRAPYLTTDTIPMSGSPLAPAPVFQVYGFVGGVLTAIGSPVTTGFTAIPNITNGYWVNIDVTPNGAFGDFYGIAVFTGINGSQAAAVELYSPPTSDPSSLIICKVAPFLSSDTIATIGSPSIPNPGYQLYDVDGAASGSHVTSGIAAISGVTNGFAANITLTPDANNGAQFSILWDGG